jgi:hypothetical protein
MARKKQKRPVDDSPEAAARRRETHARANERLREQWQARARRKGRLGSSSLNAEKFEELAARRDELPKRDRKAEAERIRKERAKAAAERKAASSVTPGKGKPKPHGKPRGTGGRLTKGS